jgi:hypothetical protein
VPAFLVRKGYRSCAVVRRGFAATARDDQPTLIVGPYLAEVDFGTEEFTGVDRLSDTVASMPQGVFGLPILRKIAAVLSWSAPTLYGRPPTASSIAAKQERGK